MIDETNIGRATLDVINDNTHCIKLTGDRMEEKGAIARIAIASLYEEIFMARQTMARIWSLTILDGESQCSGLSICHPLSRHLRSENYQS